MNLEKEVKSIISNLSGKEEVFDKDSLQDDLGLDSFSLVVMLVEFEDFFGIELQESDMNPFDLITVADAIELVEKYYEE